MKVSPKSKSTDEEVTAAMLRHRGSYGVERFLHPKLPGMFNPTKMKSKGMAFRKKRYVEVLNASMGNHSLALFYCLWKPAEFRALLAEDADWQEAIADARAEIADRAAFMLHKGLGLVASEGDAEPTPQAGAVLAKLVEGMAKAQPASTGKEKKAYRLRVDGLALPGSKPPLPPGAAGAA